MAAKLFNLEVHTPYRRFYADTVEALVVTLIDGEIGVYADHTFFTAPVVTGVLKIRDKEGRWKQAFITEGVLEVSGHRTILMVDAAEWPEEIDRDRALAAKERAEEQLEAAVFKFETDNARSTLRRAENRLKVCASADAGK
ncbi:MAG: ATP synthase F1 subunit epsilon [Spirochaetaceae bacterium]|jgi:F-type H+-transporting ATPase subunit epsilon|nr:ATP synthase F1 subunit epsilon [Spirochaetaceae bacterium]